MSFFLIERNLHVKDIVMYDEVCLFEDIKVHLILCDGRSGFSTFGLQIIFTALSCEWFKGS